VTIGDRPSRRATETNPALSRVSRPREAENRERPNSAQPSNASSKSADRSQPAKSQQADATWSDFPGSREAGSHQAQGIGPYNGRRLNSGEGVDSLLPVTQKVAFMQEGREGPTALGEWNRVVEVAGDLMEPTEDYPRRYRVREFPGAADLEAIGLSEM
jgi:hypothetical protein